MKPAAIRQYKVSHDKRDLAQFLNVCLSAADPAQFYKVCLTIEDTPRHKPRRRCIGATFADAVHVFAPSRKIEIVVI